MRPHIIGFLLLSASIICEGQVLSYSTYLGGNNSTFGGQTFPARTFISAVAIDASNNVYVTGHTDAVDFPITSGAYDAVISISQSRDGAFSDDEFLSKFSSSGKLIYSTFLGPGLETPTPVLAVDPAGNAYVASTGTSCDDCQ